MFPKILFTLALLAAPIAHACVITPHNIAGIQLGQTLAQVKHAHPQAKISSEADAEVGDITLITLPNNIEIFALLDDDTSQITWLETPSPACHTANGIHPPHDITRCRKNAGQRARY